MPGDIPLSKSELTVVWPNGKNILPLKHPPCPSPFSSPYSALTSKPPIPYAINPTPP